MVSFCGVRCRKTSAAGKFLNARRIHSALQYKTPDEVYFGTCNSANRGYISSRPLSFRKSCPVKGAGHSS